MESGGRRHRDGTMSFAGLARHHTRPVQWGPRQPAAYPWVLPPRRSQWSKVESQREVCCRSGESATFAGCFRGRELSREGCDRGILGQGKPVRLSRLKEEAASLKPPPVDTHNRPDCERNSPRYERWRTTSRAAEGRRALEGPEGHAADGTGVVGLESLILVSRACNTQAAVVR